MYEHEGVGRKKARGLLAKAGYRSGGHVKAKHVGEAMVNAAGGQPPQMKKARKLAEGGVAAEGEAPAGQLDKPSRGGKKGMTVNIVVGAPKAEAPAPVMAPPMPPPMPPRPPVRPQMPMGQQPNPMAGAPMGGVPGMKDGGRLGGKAGAKMTAGAASAEGRLEKVAIQKKDRRGGK